MHARVPKEIHQERLKMHLANVADRQKYFDPETMEFFDTLVEERECPVCHKNHEQFIFFKDGGRYVKCRECAMIYLNPVFKNEHLENHYRNNHDCQSEIVTNDSEFYTALYTKGLRAIEAVTSKGNILDIGCSSGNFLDCAVQSNWKTFGVELNEKESAYAVQKGHTVYNQLLESVNFTEKMDAVSLWDVFEHLKDGRSYLEQIKALLSDTGVIFLQIPSADSLAAKMLREKCQMFDGIEHVNLYSYKAIEKLAHECGLEIMSCETVISEIGVMNNYLNYDDPYLGETTNLLSVAGLIDEKALHDARMGYKMQLVLGKPQ
ncbi:class I SAM-dependent methyltransferase [Sulfuricurvum sp.]|uniref:class I SAM-dependent methyltransferase n=1 Tax=Sulfuricurvum sp. TaxID=2025608 RepID=UPI003BAE4D32